MVDSLAAIVMNKTARERESGMSEETFVCTACPGWGDHEYRALKTIVKDGKILRTERLDYAGPESEEGYICQKGVAAARQPYNPDRVQGPMKRVGARGEGKWKRISWDQASTKLRRSSLSFATSTVLTASRCGTSRHRYPRRLACTT